MAGYNQRLPHRLQRRAKLWLGLDPDEYGAVLDGARLSCWHRQRQSRAVRPRATRAESVPDLSHSRGKILQCNISHVDMHAVNLVGVVTCCGTSTRPCRFLGSIVSCMVAVKQEIIPRRHLVLEILMLLAQPQKKTGQEMECLGTQVKGLS